MDKINNVHDKFFRKTFGDPENVKETKIDGGDIMPTLAQRWKDEGKKEWIEVGMQKGMKTGMKTGMKAERLKTAKRMLSDNVSIETIAKYTDLTEKEVRSLMH